MPRYFRKVIRIQACDSPNVRLALAEIAAGLEPSNRVLVPGVITWADYSKRRATWPINRQTVGLDAAFYLGSEVMMFPAEWLARSERYAEQLGGRVRKAKAVGIDPAEGGDRTAMAAVDEMGLIELVSKRTPNTAVITGEAAAFARKHDVPWDRVVFDRGGGGKEHADRLIEQGCRGVRSVGFGESLMLDPKRGMTQVETKIDNRAERYQFVNRRAEMYHNLRVLLDPGVNDHGFALPRRYDDLGEGRSLFGQLRPVPLEYDAEGRLKLRPKNRKPGEEAEGKRVKTLVELIGYSPDEADALVLAVWGMLHKAPKNLAGAAS